MARPHAATTGDLTVPENRKPGFSFENIDDGDFEVQDLTNGLVTNIARNKRPPGSFKELLNARVRRDFIVRRGGQARYITEPDSNQVLKIIPARISGNVDYIVRVSLGSIHSTATETAWAAAMTTSGTQYSLFLRMTSAQFLDDIYIANLEKKISRIVLSTNEFDEIEQAPIARYITTFAERIVAAYVVGAQIETTQIKWSGNANPLIWDPLEDLTAGEENLITSPSDTGDEITGIFAFGQNLAVLMRERSIWHITRQPYAIAPFRFTPIITDVGCDMPYTAVRTPRGIVFCDFRTNAVWLYAPGNAPQKLSVPIQDILFEDLELKEHAEGVYLPDTEEYVVSYNTNANTKNRLGKARIFNFDVQAWSVDDGPTYSTMAVVSKVGTPTVIDSLTGMIDALTGTIDELSTQGNKPQILLRGDEDGRVMLFSQDTGTDLTLAGVALPFDMFIESQDLVGTMKRRKLKELLLVSDAEDDGTEGVIIRLSKNGKAFVTEKTYLDMNTASRSKVGIKRNHKVGDKIAWQLETDAKNFKLYEWAAKLLQKETKELVEEGT